MVMLPRVVARGVGATHASGRSRDSDMVDRRREILRSSERLRYNWVGNLLEVEAVGNRDLTSVLVVE